MVSLFDAGLGEFLVPTFLFIMIYAIIFGVLQKAKIFGDNTTLNTVIAFGLTVLFAIMPGAMKLIAAIAPWFVVIVIVAFSLLLVFMFMGVSTDKIEQIARDPTVVWTVIILGIIIIVGGLTAVYGPVFGAGTTGTDGTGSEIQRTIFNPRVLTAVFLLLIFAFAVKFLSYEVELK